MKGKRKKRYEELWIKIRDFIRLLTKNLDDYKDQIHSDDKLHLNNTIEILTITIVLRAVFNENNKF